MIYWRLFLAFFKIGLFAVGGAYSFLPLTEREVVERYHWLTPGEFLEISGIVKMFPGAISVKYATYVGNKMAGVAGAVVANVANLLAPVTLVLAAAVLYRKYRDVPAVGGGLRAVQLAVFALIIAAAFKTVSPGMLMRGPALALVVAAFSLFMYTKIEPMFILLVAALLGAFLRFA
ncbi:MAG: chromate transporter [Deltaproteobacteria bacterium]